MGDLITIDNIVERCDLFTDIMSQITATWNKGIFRVEFLNSRHIGNMKTSAILKLMKTMLAGRVSTLFGVRAVPPVKSRRKPGE